MCKHGAVWLSKHNVCRLMRALLAAQQHAHAWHYLRLSTAGYAVPWSVTGSIHRHQHMNTVSCMLHAHVHLSCNANATAYMSLTCHQSPYLIL